jgi:hypothetical protein
MTTSSNLISKVIVVALVLWGGYLALGASGVWQSDGTSFNLRKAAIVAACSLAFLALWRLVIVGKSKHDHRDAAGKSLADSSLAVDSKHGFSWLNWLPLMLAVSAWIVALTPLVIPMNSRRSAVAFLSINLALWLTAMISGIIQLSAPTDTGKKSAGIAVLLGAALAFYVLISPLISKAAPSTFSPPIPAVSR